MLFINEPWKKHAIICLIVSFASLLIFFRELIPISFKFYIVTVFTLTSFLYLVIWLFYSTFFKRIKNLYNDFTELNNHEYSQYGSITSNLFVIFVISLYLIVFYTYFAALEEGNLYKLLFAWLPVLIIRISHYADFETGFKIGKAVTNYILPIWFILLAYHVDKIIKDFFPILNKNYSVICYFISLVAITYLLEIFMSRKNENIVSSNKTNNDCNKQIILAKYTEILFSKE